MKKDRVRTITVYVEDQDISKIHIKGYSIVVIGKKKRNVFVPNKYNDLSEKIFSAIRKETGFTKKHVCAKGRVVKLSVMREMFLYLFFKRFPDATLEIAGHFIGRTHCSVINAQKNYSRHMKDNFKNHFDTVQFWELEKKIRTHLG